MSHLRSVIAFLANSAETASDETYLDQTYLAPDAKDLQIAYYALVVRRANEILDKQKDDIFNQVMNIANRAEMEQATRAYDKDYFLSLPLSLESICELAQNLISLGRTFKVQPPRVWVEVSKFNMLDNNPTERDAYPRKVADL